MWLQVAGIYFLSFYVVGVFAVLNLFVAVILDNFTFCSNADTAMVSEEALADFQKQWFELTMNDPDMAYHLGGFMATHRIREFMMNIGEPLGANKGWSRDSVRRYKLIMTEVTQPDSQPI